MARKKQKLFRACKKRPVWRGGDVKDPGPYCKKCYHMWRGGDVKDPGPYCKKCYHKQVWPAKRSPGQKTAEPPTDPDYDHCPECGVEADVCGGGTCPNCRFEFNNALYWWFAR